MIQLLDDGSTGMIDVAIPNPNIEFILNSDGFQVLYADATDIILVTRIASSNFSLNRESVFSGAKSQAPLTANMQLVGLAEDFIFYVDLVGEVAGRLDLSSASGDVEELTLESGQTFVESAASEYGVAFHVFRDSASILHLYKHPYSGPARRYVLDNPDPNVTINTTPHFMGEFDAFLTGTTSFFNGKPLPSPGLYFIDFSLSATICSNEDYLMSGFPLSKTSTSGFIFSSTSGN